MKTILVTGASGFIGRLVSQSLLNNGHKVITTSRSDVELDATNTGEHIHIKKDLLNSSFDWSKLPLNKVQVIVHLACDFREDSYKENIGLGKNLIHKIGKNIEIIIFASTAYIYSPSYDLIKEDGCIKPEIKYSTAKLEIENLYRSISKLNRFKLFNLRISSIYGPGNPHSKAIINFYKKIMKGEDIKIFGDIHRKREYVHIDDVVSIFTLLVNNYRSLKSGDYNVGTGAGYSPLEVANILSKNSKVIISEGSNLNDNLKGIVLDMEKTKRELNFKSKVIFEKGLKDGFFDYIKLEKSKSQKFILYQS
jgi:nucleoside-diphosphate-sugar epimerase